MRHNRQLLNAHRWLRRAREDYSLRPIPPRRSTSGRPGNKPPLERIADEARFIKAWFDNPGITGAVSPSSRALARAMAESVDPHLDGPVIELGPGTGPVTQALLTRGVAPERLWLIEFDPKFCRLLERRFPRCNIIQGDAYNLATTLEGCGATPASAIVSSLPLLNKSEAERYALLDEAFTLMHEAGRFVQFTYGMVSPVPKRSKSGEALGFDARASAPVWLNLPPARVWVYRRIDANRPERAKAGARFIGKLREGRDKMRDEFKETTERVELNIKSRTEKAKREILIASRRVREDRAIKPAIDFLKKIGEPKRPKGR